MSPAQVAHAQFTCDAPVIWNGGVYNDDQGGFVPNVEGLDWSSAGSGIFEGIGPIGTALVTGTEFTLRYQAVLVGLTAANGDPVFFPGLNGDFEYTMIAEIPMIVLSVVNVVGLQILTFATQAGGEFYIYHDANRNYVISTGAGFDDATIVANGYIEAGQVANFTYSAAANSAVGSFTFDSPLTYINPTFIDPTSNLVELQLQGTLNYPPLDSTTTTFFAGRAGEGHLDDYSVTSNDIRLKIDTSSKLYDCFPSVSLRKRLIRPLDGIANVGDSVLYELQVENSGDFLIDELTVVDTFDATYLQYTNALTVTPDLSTTGHLTWTDSLADFLPLAVGDHFTITVSFEAITPTE